MEAQIYKQGQGYWTRVMTALGAGVLIFAGAHWASQQTQLLLGADHPYLMYWRAGVGLAVVALLAPMVFKWVARKPRSCDFLIATEGEMKKVNWPTKREVYGATRVVIFVVIIFACVLFAADFAFSWFFRQIGVLEA